PSIDAPSGGTVARGPAVVAGVPRTARDDTKISPGHGPLARKADLKAYRDMLAAVSGNIRGQLKAGKTLEQVIASKPTAKYDAVWGKGFLAPEKFVEMVYKNLKK